MCHGNTVGVICMIGSMSAEKHGGALYIVAWEQANTIQHTRRRVYLGDRLARITGASNNNYRGILHTVNIALHHLVLFAVFPYRSSYARE